MSRKHVPLCAGLLLALVPALTTARAQAPMPAPATAPAADTPAVAVVRQFLADRAARWNLAAYLLLSAKSRQNISLADFEAGRPLPLSDAGKVPAPLFALSALLVDTHNTLKYTFAVVGPDPVDPNIVLVRADRDAAGRADVPAVTLRLVTVSDPAAHAPRVDPLGSLERAAPQVFAKARENARRAVSQNNLNFLVVGIERYQTDHDVMPDADRWVDEIMPYIGTTAAFRDPSAPPGEAWSYAFNRALSHKPIGLGEGPASTVMLFESSKGVKNASDTGQSVPRPGRHRGGTDYAFADGHVKWSADGAKLSYRLSGK